MGIFEFVFITGKENTKMKSNIMKFAITVAAVVAGIYAYEKINSKKSNA